MSTAKKSENLFGRNIFLNDSSDLTFLNFVYK